MPRAKKARVGDAVQEATHTIKTGTARGTHCESVYTVEGTSVRCEKKVGHEQVRHLHKFAGPQKARITWR